MSAKRKPKSEPHVQKIAKLLAMQQPITGKVIMDEMQVSAGTSRNILSRWTNVEKVLVRLGPDCYRSVLAQNNERQIILQSLYKAFNDDVILVGPSAWEAAGWARSSKLYIATSTPPSRPVPKFTNVEIYQLGNIKFTKLLQTYCVANSEGKPYLTPINQMLWWLQGDCPVTMAAPDTIYWDKVVSNRDLLAAMRTAWDGDLKTLDADGIPNIYAMMHMDRLTGAVDGSAAPLNSADALTTEDEGEVNLESQSFDLS